MTKATELRNTFTLEEYNTALSRADYERFFTKTKETVRFTFNGWDGKSYDGESRNAKVIRCNKPGYEDIRFIKVGNHLCSIGGIRHRYGRNQGLYEPGRDADGA